MKADVIRDALPALAVVDRCLQVEVRGYFSREKNRGLAIRRETTGRLECHADGEGKGVHQRRGERAGRTEFDQVEADLLHHHCHLLPGYRRDVALEDVVFLTEAPKLALEQELQSSLPRGDVGERQR